MVKFRYIIADGNSFEAITQRVHHLATNLSKENYILYIEEPGNIISVFLSPEKPLANLWKWRKGLRLEKNHIYIFTPPPLLPFGYIFPSVNAFNHFIQGSILRHFLKGHDISNAVVVVPNILGKGWRHFFKKSPLVYDCCDEITEFKIPSLRKEAVKQQEMELMHDADLVVVTSQLLWEKKRIYNSDTAIVRNGCEHELFAKAEELRNEVPPKDLEPIRKLGPILGFFGNIGPWFDVDLVAGILDKRPKWQIVLIGPVFISTDRFKLFPNCHILGKKPYSQLPSYLAHFDCGIIPFVHSELTRYVNPVKAYEYLAGGVGVVGTSLDEYRYFENMVAEADTIDSFVSAVEQMMKQNYMEARKKRMEFASRQSWRSRLDQYMELIGIAEEKSAKRRVASKQVEPVETE